MQSASLPQFLLVYLCANVGPWGATGCSACPVLHHFESGPLGLSLRECGAAGSASGQTACPVCPTLRQSRSRHSNASPLRPGCPSPPLLPVSMNVSFYLLGVGLLWRSIFCQFWLCEEAQCVYLCHHLGSPHVLILLFSLCHFFPTLFFIIFIFLMWALFVVLLSVRLDCLLENFLGF